MHINDKLRGPSEANIIVVPLRRRQASSVGRFREVES